jgi:hypothetical protein
MGYIPHYNCSSRLQSFEVDEHPYDNRKKLMKPTPPGDATNRKRLSGGLSLPLLWLIGVPVPILVIIFLFRGYSG